MGLENTDTIGGLDASWPLNSDPTSQGNDHLQQLKVVLKNIFPGRQEGGEPGSGFTQKLTVTEEEINHLNGARDNLQQQIDDLIGLGGVSTQLLTGPHGTRLIYANAETATAPLGWIKDETQDGRMLVIHTGNQNISSGVNDPRLWIHTHTVDPFTLTSAHLPKHWHGIQARWADLAQGNTFNGSRIGSVSVINSTYQTNEDVNGMTRDPFPFTVTLSTPSPKFQPKVYQMMMIRRDVPPDERV